MKMKAFVALVLALGLFTACSSSSDETPTVGETSSAEEQVVVQLDDEAIVVDDESASADPAFSNVPDDWPADMPVPEGGNLEAWTVPFENEVRASWRIEGVSVMDAAEAYSTALSTLGFDESEFLSEETQATGNYANAERTVTFEVTSTSDGATSIYVVHTFIN
jgi:hypothetical protein